MLIGVLVLGQYVFADGTNPIRTVHQVKAGDSTYCFSVQKNVVMTPEEVAEFEDDEALAAEILNRAGLFMRESSCKSDDHPPIAMEEWLRDGNTLALSQEDIALIRQASPEEGRTVKLHMDVYFTLKADEDKAKEEQGQKGTETDPEDKPSEDTSGEDPSGLHWEDTDGETPADSRDDQDGDQSSSDTGKDTPADTEDDTSKDLADDSGKDSSEDPRDGSSEDPATDHGEGTSDEDTDDPSGDPGDDPSEDPGDDPGDDPSDEPGDDPSEDPEDKPYVRPVYSTYKLTSPELLFVVIATETDAVVVEDECEEEGSEEPEEPEIPEMPEIDIDIPSGEEDILPEYRKIEMKDKSGQPLDPVLEEGEPVELIWIEPKTIDVDTAKSWIEKYPGGLAGIGGTLAAVGAGIAAIAYAVKRRRDEDE